MVISYDCGGKYSRPKRLLSEISEFREKLIYSLINDHLNSYNLLSFRQSCFRKSNRTTTALTIKIDQIIIELERAGNCANTRRF